MTRSMKNPLRRRSSNQLSQKMKMVFASFCDVVHHLAWFAKASTNRCLAANGIIASFAVGNTCATASGSKSDGSIIVVRPLQNSSVCISGASFLLP